MQEPRLDRRRLRGLIGYFGPGGVRTGRELFSISVHADGSRTLRAQCEMDDDQLVRDALLAVGPDWRPREAYVRLVQHGRHRGSGWYLIEGATVRLEAQTPAGPVSDRRTLAAPPRFFGTHALVNDGWATALGSGSLGAQPACSLAANGATEPRIELGDIAVQAVGEERLTTPAGAFPTMVHDILYGDYPPIRVWVTGPDHLLVRMEWAYLRGCYELLELESAPR